LLLLSVIIIFTFATLSSLNLYPSKYARHVVWLAPIAWISIYHTLYLFLERLESSFHVSPNIRSLFKLHGIDFAVRHNLALVPTLLTTLFFMGTSIFSISRLITIPPKSDTFDALKFVRDSGGRKIMVNNGGQAVLAFFERKYPDIKDWETVGEMRPDSAIALPAKSLQLLHLTIDKSLPGAWARYVQPNSDKDSLFKQNLAEIIHNGSFFIFSYWPGSLTSSQESLLSRHSCNVVQKKEFGAVFVYEIICRPNI